MRGLSWRREERDVWQANEAPVRVRREVDERTHTFVFEVHNTTQYVDKRPTLGEAMKLAEGLGWRVAS